ncbi:MAG: chorismate synthase [Peptoniphilaceae bacterium]|nr:chorismate synthase [Peptoniphilaceae bacterium]MDY6086292.1 chorismate synthase [Peptoniphilaceae bacterium]
MKNTFGQAIAMTIVGESHGPMIGAVLDGLAPGIVVEREWIASRLRLRSARGEIATARHEKDAFRLESGVLEAEPGRWVTTGTPILIAIPNHDTISKDYTRTGDLLRPGHADYTAYAKYHGYQDIRGGGHFSGRLTAAVVAAGAILQSALGEKGIRFGTHVLRLAGIDDVRLQGKTEDELSEAVDTLRDRDFPVVDPEREAPMTDAILRAKGDKDSVGGILETVILGLAPGLGEPFFDSVEGLLAHALFAIPAVKGVSFGDGVALADMRGSAANDAPVMDGESLRFRSNHNGGVNGGITNGMPVVFQTVVKPTPSIAKAQDTVDYKRRENATLALKGRHDPAIVPRAREVVNAMSALVVADLIAQRYGTDALGPERRTR